MYSDPLRAVLLYKKWRRWQVSRFWSWQPPVTEQDLRSTANSATGAVITPHPVTHVSPLVWSEFLHYLIDKLQRFGRLPNLSINVGIPYQACAWLTPPPGTIATWKSYAATHWQRPPADVLMDVLPISNHEALLGSIPTSYLDHYLDGLQAFSPLSKQIIRLGVDTDLSAIMKVWPWYRRHELAVARGTNENYVYANANGLHHGHPSKLPEHIHHLFTTPQHEQNQTHLTQQRTLQHQYQHQDHLGHHGQDTKALWYWQIPHLDDAYWEAWHLAYIPPPTKNQGLKQDRKGIYTGMVASSLTKSSSGASTYGLPNIEGWHLYTNNHNSE